MEYRVILGVWLLLATVLVQLKDYGSSCCLDIERNGLLKLKDAFKYPNGTSAVSSWGGEERDCCKWEKVLCDNSTKRVIRLSLNETRISELSETDSPPNDIILEASLFFPFQELLNLSLAYNFLKGFQGALQLGSLQVLDLSGNKFTSIPSLGFQGASQLGRLQVLDLSSNSLTSIPSLGELQSLKFLNLGYNRFTNLSGFQELTKLRNLEMLDLSDNKLTSVPYLGELQSLKFLNLELNRFNFSGFQELTKLRNLEMLNLGDNELTGEMPPSIGVLTSLKALSFRYNQLNGSLPEEELCKLKNLQELDLSGNSFEGYIPLCLGNLTSLRLLELSTNNFGGNIPSTLFLNLKSLEYVSLSYNHFQGSFSLSSFENNSKLEGFELDNLKVETENPPWTPLSLLKGFRLSNCKLNAIPSFLFNQNDLRSVDLSHNNIVGELPSWLLVNNTRLEILSLRNNLPTGSLDLYSKNLDMLYIDISMNNFHGNIPPSIGSVLPNLELLNMSNNALQGNIPSSIGDMELLELLDLSNNNFSVELPEPLLRGCVGLEKLKLSNNSFEGQVLPAISNLTRLYYLYLDSNHFSGELSIGLLNSTSLELLDLSNNKISCQIPDWIGNFSFLRFLVLSENNLSGPIPMRFCKLEQLIFLDLSWNHLLDTLPSCFNASSLEYLHLQGNQFIEPLPNVLSTLSFLVTLDMRDNYFLREIPNWISSLSSLRILLLKGNSLKGSIPFQICELKNISILDISSNNLSGRIPHCLHNIPFGRKRALDDMLNWGDYSWTSFGTNSYESPLRIYEYEVESDKLFVEEVGFISKSRTESYTGNILNFMSGIDLSLNNLTGSIPLEIGYLSNIHTLNLSNNNLSGSIPRTFMKLKQIESLDLSHNMLTGQIPSKLVELTFLSVFSVAYNNLSGKIPEWKAQFGTFGKSSYENNSFLCGSPLETSCTNTIALPPPSDLDQNDPFKEAFLTSFAGSYIVTLLCFIACLYFNPYWRGLLFRFIERTIRKAFQIM